MTTKYLPHNAACFLCLGEEINSMASEIQHTVHSLSYLEDLEYGFVRNKLARVESLAREIARLTTDMEHGTRYE